MTINLYPITIDDDDINEMANDTRQMHMYNPNIPLHECADDTVTAFLSEYYPELFGHMKNDDIIALIDKVILIADTYEDYDPKSDV